MLLMSYCRIAVARQLGYLTCVFVLYKHLCAIVEMWPRQTCCQRQLVDLNAKLHKLAHHIPRETVHHVSVLSLVYAVRMKVAV